MPALAQDCLAAAGLTLILLSAAAAAEAPAAVPAVTAAAAAAVAASPAECLALTGWPASVIVNGKGR